MPPTPDRPLLIGWKEFADFPEWCLRRVKVKVDTGARTSALGADDFRVRPAADGTGELIEMRLRLYRYRPHLVTEFHLPVVRRVRVRNSGGQVEERPVIETLLALGPVRKRVTFTVTRRPHMLVPVLLGRAALADDFLVDPGRKFIVSGLRRT
jgi:hypothetical protein